MGDGDFTDRCPTGIEGFDAICQGGLVRNSSNVLIGGAGAGKTTFLLQFLWNGVTMFNENGLYCSFEPDIVETLKDAMSFKWDFTKLNELERVKFLKFSPRTKFSDLKSELTKMVTKHQIRRICFDPVSVLTLNEENQGKLRDIIFDLTALMKRMGVTSILADESIEDTILYREKTSWSDTDILKFLADGVIIFHQSAFSEEADRSLQITKMRRTNHLRLPVGMRIDESGIDVMRLNGEPFPKVVTNNIQQNSLENSSQNGTQQINQEKSIQQTNKQEIQQTEDKLNVLAGQNTNLN